MNSMPKVVQLAPVVVPGMDNMSRPSLLLFALRDDGSMWIAMDPSQYSTWWQQIQGPSDQIGFPPDRPYYAVEELKKALGPEVFKQVKGIVANAGGRLD